MCQVWFCFINILWRWHVVGSTMKCDAAKTFFCHWRTCLWLQTTESREGSFTRNTTNWCGEENRNRGFCFLLLTTCTHRGPTNFSAMKMANNCKSLKSKEKKDNQQTWFVWFNRSSGDSCPSYTRHPLPLATALALIRTFLHFNCGFQVPLPMILQDWLQHFCKLTVAFRYQLPMIL